MSRPTSTMSPESQSQDDFTLGQMDPGSAYADAVGFGRQVMSADLITRGEGWERGVRSVLLGNDVVAIEVVVDRGLDIGSARVRQSPVAWRSPTEIVAPWFVENQGFGAHRSFYGGLLTTCGLDHVGAPGGRSAERFGYPSRTIESFPMHGRASGTPGRLIGYGLVDSAEGPEVFVEGELHQVAVFGENLVLRRRVSLRYRSSVVRVEDRLRNAGYAMSPVAIVYHVNAGWPVVGPAALIMVDGVVPSVENDFSRVRVPERASTERTWMHRPTGERGRKVSASITNPIASIDAALGMRVTWDPSSLPSMAQWEIANTAGHYAVALEPATILPAQTDGLAFPTLEPGETMTLGVDIELLHGPRGTDLSKS